MAKKKQTMSASEKERNLVPKHVRTANNSAKAQAKHKKQVEKKQAAPVKTPRGTARALRRWAEMTSREWPMVLAKGPHKEHTITRAKRKHVPQVESAPVAINGKQMGSLVEAAWTARHLKEVRPA